MSLVSEIKNNKHYEKIIYISMTVLVIKLLAWLFNHSVFNLNFVDEAFYLNWFENGPLYQFSTSGFGFFYRPFYLLLDENLVYLRRLNLILNYLLGLILSIQIIKLYNIKLDLHGYCLALAVSTAALLIVIRQDVLLQTPSYNTLTFQGACVFFLGLIQLNKSGYININLAGFLIGLGGWMVFLGKPTSAFLVGLVFLFSLIFNKKNIKEIIFFSVIYTSLFFILSAYLIDGSIEKFVERYKEGVYSLSLFDAGHKTNLIEMFRLDIEEINFTLSYVICLITTATLLAFFIYRLTINDWLSQAIKYPLIITSLTCAYLVLYEIYQPLFFYHEFYMMINLSLLIGVCIGLSLAKVKLETNVIFLSICFTLMPYILAYGSGNNYWHLSSSASFFWVLAGFNLLAHLSNKYQNNGPVLIYVSLVISLATIFLWISAHFPKNKLNFSSSDYFSYDINNSYQLNLAKPTAIYFSKLRYQAKKLGFKSETPIIDLTGQYGLSIFILDAKAIGLPVLYGGYNGSAKLAKYALDKVDCKTLAESWLLYEPTSYRKLPSQLLANYGLNINLDYEYSDMFRGVPSKGNPILHQGKLIRTSNKQYLLKPKKPFLELYDSCIRAKNPPRI
jgi:hypothetical protein